MIDLYSLGATRIIVGLSNIVKVTPPPSMNAFMIANISTAAGGTLEIVPASTFTAGTGWGLGYPLQPNNEYAVSGPVTFYLAATGVTATIAMMAGYSQGATLL